MSKTTYLRRAIAAAASLLSLLALASPAGAQTTESRTFMGWTGTGNEVVQRVSKSRSGINDDGDPEAWAYTLLEIANSETGRVVGHYQVGSPSGQTQSEWTDAKNEAAGGKRVGALGKIAGIEAPVSPDGTMTLVALQSNSRTEGIMTAECMGCVTCTTSQRVLLVHSARRKVFVVAEHDSVGSAFPPDEATGDCPKVDTEFYWHPQSTRFAVVYTDRVLSTGAEIDSVEAKLIAKGLGSWQSHPIPERTDRRKEGLYKRVEALKKQLQASDDPKDKAQILINLGDVSRELGKIDAAAGLYATALEYDKKAIRANLGQAFVALQDGKERQALAIVKKVEKADRKKKALGMELGLFYLIAGDTGRAEKHLQASVDSGGGADFATRLDLGLRILNADATAGMAYLDNLLSSVPEGLPKDVSDRLVATYALLADEGINIRDIPFAAAFTSRLPNGSDEAQRLALQISAMRSDDPKKAQLAMERTTKLLDETPTKCDLYFVRGMALRRLNKLHRAFGNFAAAVSCDPQHHEAHYYLAEMYSIAGQLDKARDHYQVFMDLAPPRRGDPARTLRRARIESLLPRLKHKGVIMLSHDCAARSGKIRCTGVLSNTGAGKSGSVSVALTATSRGRRPKVVGAGAAELSGVAAGATVDFAVTMDALEDMDLELTLGSSDAERALNRTRVQIY